MFTLTINLVIHRLILEWYFFNSIFDIVITKENDP